MKVQLKRKKLCSLVLTLFGMVFFLSNAWAESTTPIPFHLKQNPQAPSISASALSEAVENQIFEQTNVERSDDKKSKLSTEEDLVKAARDHSKDMLRRNYLSHFSPEQKSVVDRLKKYQPKLQRSVGENLHTISSGSGLRDAQAIASLMMKDWMQSKDHRKNILSKQFDYLGVGCASDGHKIFCTQVFAGEK